VPGIPYQIVATLQFLPYTGLQVSHEPGQWAVWTGCLLMGLGLVLAFWVLHQRYWIVPVRNKEGKLVLWVGAAANKSREGFADRFAQLTAEIEKQLNETEELCVAAQASAAHS
jgi:cytochrome c biogenesis protein